VYGRYLRLLFDLFCYKQEKIDGAQHILYEIIELCMVAGSE
jgi:hypothetical protein